MRGSEWAEDGPHARVGHGLALLRLNLAGGQAVGVRVRLYRLAGRVGERCEVWWVWHEGGLSVQDIATHSA